MAVYVKQDFLRASFNYWHLTPIIRAICIALQHSTIKMSTKITLKNSTNVRAEQHPFYSIQYSPWPIWLSIAVLGLVIFSTFKILHKDWYNKIEFSNFFFLSSVVYKTSKLLLISCVTLPFTFINNYTLWNLFYTKVNYFTVIFPSTNALAQIDGLWNFYWGFVDTGGTTLTTFIYKSEISLFFWIILLAISIYGWSRDVITEAVYMGYHTLAVQKCLRQGFIIFILTEVMFFFGFFWSYLHYSLNPSIMIGGIWPPKGITAVNPYGLPLLNTVILLYSGLTITWAHQELLARNPYSTFTALLATIFLGTIFLIFQGYEYSAIEFSINTSVYGSIFFLMTGFHGMHVFVGLILIIIATIRVLLAHFTVEHHVGFETAAWYWHFVDIVWLFLYVIVYWWTS